jgi:hypothetical protein
MSELKVVNNTTPACCHLRSNGMYVNGTADPVQAAMPGSGDGNFWCLKTMHLFGPDNADVNRHVCNPTRSCYETVQ